MSDSRKRADAIREAYLEDAAPENVTMLEDIDDCSVSYSLNMKRYSLDGHSWNGKPYVCIDARRF